MYIVRILSIQIPIQIPIPVDILIDTTTCNFELKKLRFYKMSKGSTFFLLPQGNNKASTEQNWEPQVCEGEVSQVLPSCCCQTLWPALLPIDQACALCHKITHISVFCTNWAISHSQMFYYSTTHCHTAYTLFIYNVYESISHFLLYCLLQCITMYSTVFWLLWWRNFPCLWDK